MIILEKMDELKPINIQTTSTTESSLSGQQSNPITRKLNKILESRIENDKVSLLKF